MRSKPQQVCLSPKRAMGRSLPRVYRAHCHLNVIVSGDILQRKEPHLLSGLGQKL
jgi:hypothetical protein